MQKIIRNVSNLDRAPVDRIPVERVYEAVKRLGEAVEFSSKEIAETLGVREYKVRGSIGWLIKRNVVETAGVVRLRTKSAYPRPYFVQRYRLKPISGGAPDFNALMAVFCR
jgi:predicted ArsR family transcriptional regulator